MEANLNYPQRKGSFVTYLCFSPWVFGERSGVREVRMINSTWPGSPFWRNSSQTNAWAILVQQWFHGSTRNACGCSQMGAEGFWYMACSLLLPFSFHFTGNLPHNKLCRISPSGPFLLLPPPSSVWPAGPLAATAADLLSKCGKQQGQKPSLKLLLNLLDGLTPDAARPIRRGWLIWCLSSSVMKWKAMGSQGCLDEEQEVDVLPAPLNLGSLLEIEWNQRVPTPPFS